MIPKIYIDCGSDHLNVQLKYLCNNEKTAKLLNIVDIDYVPTKGDKIALLTGVYLPRVKLKSFNEEHGTKNVREYDKADYIFASDNTCLEYFKQSSFWYYPLKFEDFEKVLPELGSYFDIDPTDIKDLEDVVDAHKVLYGEPEIVFSWSSHKEIQKLCSDRNIIIDSTYFNDSKYYKEVDDEFVEEIKDLQTRTIYNVNGLIAAINSKNVVIDYEMFGKLKNMFESNDTDNHVLAMEIMANSSPIESLLYLEMLFKDHSYTIYNTHTKNHVNFKSLCSMIGKDSYRFDTSLDDIVRSLINFNVLTKDKLDILMNHYHREILNSGDSKFFNVKTITVNAEVHDILNNNYVYSVTKDFVPKIEEEVIEEEVINLESLNTEDLTQEEEILETEEELSFELKDVNTITEEEEVSEEIIEEELPVVEDTTENINPITTEEDGDTEVDWF